MSFAARRDSGTVENGAVILRGGFVIDEGAGNQRVDQEVRVGVDHFDRSKKPSAARIGNGELPAQSGFGSQRGFPLQVAYALSASDGTPPGADINTTRPSSHVNSDRCSSGRRFAAADSI